MDKTKSFISDWRVLVKFLPQGWRVKAEELGLLKRKRVIKSSSMLLRIFLIHLADGCSLRETAARAKQGGLADVSDVALQKKLAGLSDWFRWMCLQLIVSRGIGLTPPKWLKNKRVKSVDASVVTEPGSTGTDWRLHYCLNMFDLQCEQFMVTRPDVGESFFNFIVTEGDLFLGDRAYGRLKGLRYIVENGGEYIVRLKNKAFKIYKEDNTEFSMLDEFSNLTVGQIGEWYVVGKTNDGTELNMRLCAIRKSDLEAERAIKKAFSEAKKKQRTVDPVTLELHRYIIVVTSVGSEISARLILELYRLRWQVEIAFKRLKSIIGLGHLPKKNEASCRSWLHGKMLVALLAQAIVTEGRRFSPWGYRL
jgi:hypothetical protein